MTGPMIRPYGDTTGDGRVQLSFTLPVPFGTERERAVAEGAALQLAAKMGLEPAMVVHAKGMGPAFTFFIVYGRASHLVDLSEVTVAEREFPVLSAAEINLRIRSGLGREMVVLGACIGTDAHTVGIDAILNVKGHAGEKGDAHLAGARTLADAFSTGTAGGGASGGERRGRPLLVVGGPRFDPTMAAELGVDKIFGRGTTPREVASYLVHALIPGPVAAGAGA
jgi:beta-lysine 5,6-aminomutase beta subunit